MQHSSTSSRLLSYGSLTLGTTALLSGNADAATVVNVNATSYNTGLANIGTVSLSTTSFTFPVPPYTPTYKGRITLGDNLVGTAEAPFQRAGSGVSFAPDTTTDSSLIEYWNGGTVNGAVLGSDNWLYAVSNTDSSQRVWLQFNFNMTTSTAVTGSIIKAVFPSSIGELPTAQLASSAVPEPSALALLSLGAGGLVLRRRRRAA
ncbi:PEP-CTERM sorting domain-containing protein [Haloferula sp. BvORR071]|uniref:PEP-CTERM sorting domain-containing protein n=1 Tax=Haloferula sp. BvORR071 TaxID=1396141 RepID=UPI0005571F4F|nr:PEP-CTERM sorting domain-containing protein [Haloferula sp. BvORR071]